MTLQRYNAKNVKNRDNEKSQKKILESDRICTFAHDYPSFANNPKGVEVIIEEKSITNFDKVSLIFLHYLAKKQN